MTLALFWAMRPNSGGGGVSCEWVLFFFSPPFERARWGILLKKLLRITTLYTKTSKRTKQCRQTMEEQSVLGCLAINNTDVGESVSLIRGHSAETTTTWIGSPRAPAQPCRHRGSIQLGLIVISVNLGI